MSDSPTDALRRSMAEAAALDPGDPIRQRVEEDVARTGAWAQREWLEILDTDERFRLALRQITPPPGLEARLLAIPEQLPQRQARWARWLSILGLGTASAHSSPISRRWIVGPASVLALAVALVLLQRRSRSTLDQQLQTLALLAMQDHMNESDLVVRTSQPQFLMGDLSRRMGFSVALPDLGEPCTLLGGRPCHLGSHLVALTLWKNASGTLSLYQFRPGDFGVDVLAKPVIIEPRGPAAGDAACTVTFWTESDQGFALVRRPVSDTHG